jgi:OOP family OmpA-OmpF porin
MKSFYLAGFLFLCTTIICAQEMNKATPIQEIKTRIDQSKYTIALGVNMIDNGGDNSLPFNAETFSFKTPFFITAERRFKSNLSLALSLSTNRLTIADEEKSYVSIDAVGQFYFDDYIFKTEKIETYAGLGLGRYYLENNGNNTLNVTAGGRYWFSDHFGVSLQGYGKVGLSPINESVRNHFQYNLGLVWRSSTRKM